jgi:hypothetical protein
MQMGLLIAAAVGIGVLGYIVSALDPNRPRASAGVLESYHRAFGALRANPWLVLFPFLVSSSTLLIYLPKWIQLMKARPMQDSHRPYPHSK